MEEWIPVLITSIATFLASSGFWGFVQFRNSKDTSETKLLKGLGYFTLVGECQKHLDKGYIGKEEYYELYTHLYEPYKLLGGNGSAKRMMEAVDQLPYIRQEVG